jgi:hypothetical protein
MNRKWRKLTTRLLDNLDIVELVAADRTGVGGVQPLGHTVIVVGVAAGEQRNAQLGGDGVGVGEGMEIIAADDADVELKVAE